ASSCSVLSNSASTGSSEGSKGSLGFGLTESAGGGVAAEVTAEDSPGKGDAEKDAVCGFNVGAVAAESAARAAVGTEDGTEDRTKLGAGSAKFVRCEEAAAACACSSGMTALVMTPPAMAGPADSVAVLSFAGTSFRKRLTAVRMVLRA